MDLRSPPPLKKTKHWASNSVPFPRGSVLDCVMHGCGRIRETQAFNAFPWLLSNAQSSWFLVLPPSPPVLLMETSFSGIRFNVLSASFPSSFTSYKFCCFSPCTFFSISSSPIPTTITLVWPLRHLVLGPSSLRFIPDTTAKPLQYSSDPAIPLLRKFPWFPHQAKDMVQTWHLEPSWTGHRVFSPATLSSNPMCFSSLNHTAPYWNPIRPSGPCPPKNLLDEYLLSATWVPLSVLGMYTLYFRSFLCLNIPPTGIYHPWK